MIAPVKCLLASALAVTVVNGHGYMTDPKVTFTAQAGDPTQYIATIESTASGLTGTFNGAPSDNVAAFTKAFGSSKYSSLKEFINDKATVTVTGATLTCGSESECGSYDVAGSESDCGSYGVAGSESDCGSYGVAGGSGDDVTQTAGSQTSFDFNAAKGTNNAGTVAPYV
ncbi:hypothetical protein KRP22_015138 [Phytophthora ramorum]|nr:hypothetical protein KRP22_15071 [Phytophthora ramorum]